MQIYNIIILQIQYYIYNKVVGAKNSCLPLSVLLHKQRGQCFLDISPLIMFVAQRSVPHCKMNKTKTEDFTALIPCCLLPILVLSLSLSYTHTCTDTRTLPGHLSKSITGTRYVFKFVCVSFLHPKCLTGSGCDYQSQNCDIPGCLTKLSGVGHHFYWILISQCSFPGR